MLDFRHETFLTLCKIGNYTKTAEALHITQPAVSQHIKFLEEYYNCKLFTYEGKSLLLTDSGKLLLDFAMTMSADTKKMRHILSIQNAAKSYLTFGATLTLGEYIMPPILSNILTSYPHLHITMSVDNTEVLLEKLHDGKIDFALIEGFFDKTKYDGVIFSLEPFIAVCSKNSPLVGNNFNLTDLLNNRIILREKGSGTRDIFEHLLLKNNLTIDSFQLVCEIGNMGVIKQLVKNDYGITFLYRTAVEKELSDGELVALNIEGFPILHEFYFVFLKNSLHKIEYMEWYDFFKIRLLST